MGIFGGKKSNKTVVADDDFTRVARICPFRGLGIRRKGLAAARRGGGQRQCVEESRKPFVPGDINGQPTVTVPVLFAPC